MLYTEATPRRRVEQPTLSAIFPNLFPLLGRTWLMGRKKAFECSRSFPHLCAAAWNRCACSGRLLRYSFIAQECLYAAQVGYLLVEQERGVCVPLRLGATPSAHLVLP